MPSPIGPGNQAQDQAGNVTLMQRYPEELASYLNAVQNNETQDEKKVLSPPSEASTSPRSSSIASPNFLLEDDRLDVSNTYSAERDQEYKSSTETPSASAATTPKNVEQADIKKSAIALHSLSLWSINKVATPNNSQIMQKQDQTYCGFKKGFLMGKRFGID